MQTFSTIFAWDRVSLAALTVYLGDIDEEAIVIATDGGCVAPAVPGLRVHVLRHEMNVRRQLLTQALRAYCTSERPITGLDAAVRRVRMHGVLKRRVAVAADAHDVTRVRQRSPRSTDHFTTVVVAPKTHQAAAAASRWRTRVPVAVKVLAHIERVPRPPARRHESDGGCTSIVGSRRQRRPLCGTVRTPLGCRLYRGSTVARPTRAALGRSCRAHTCVFSSFWLNLALY